MQVTKREEIPVGVYKAKLIKWEFKRSKKNDKEYLALTYQIDALPRGSNQTIYICDARMDVGSNTHRAVQALLPLQTLKIDDYVDDRKLIGKECVVKVGEVIGADGVVRNKIVNFKQIVRTPEEIAEARARQDKINEEEAK